VKRKNVFSIRLLTPGENQIHFVCKPKPEDTLIAAFLGFPKQTESLNPFSLFWNRCFKAAFAEEH
jgi:hypothetical protein